MAGINKFNQYMNLYNSEDYSLFSGGAQLPSMSSSYSLSDYAAIKNGSYGKALKAYYKKMDAEKLSFGADSAQKNLLMKSGADALEKSAEALKKDTLWEKKETREKDEATGEETVVHDYDRDAIAKAVKTFVEDYNDAVEQAGDSDSKEVLRNAMWMTDTTDANKKVLAKIGIEVGKGNKLELDEETLRKADIGTLKMLFTGYNSFADKVSMKARSISAASSKAGVTYTSDGKYNDVVSKLVSKKVNKEV